MNLILYAFLTSKGSTNFDCKESTKGLSLLLLDKSIKVRFIALESLSYLTTIQDKEAILKIASSQLQTSKHVLAALTKRLGMNHRVKLNDEMEVQYPNLQDN